jgi:hypothetical protein
MNLIFADVQQLLTQIGESLKQTANKINVDSQKYAVGDTLNLVSNQEEQTYYEVEKYRYVRSLNFPNSSTARGIWD